MIDILLVNQHSLSQLGNLLSIVFDCSIDRVKIFGINEFNSLTEELNISTLDCVCVFSFVQGDVSQLLQLYRYKITDSDVVKRIIDIALKNKIRCYIPHDSLGGWIYVGGDDAPKHVHQIESDQENYFCFK
jgi:hypothetical protein